VIWAKAEGCRVTLADGRELLDLSGGFGVAALGHRNPRILEAWREQEVVHALGDLADAEVTVRLREALPWPAKLGVTGEDVLASGDSNSGPGVLGETLLGAVGALAVLAFVFASFLALLPLVVAASSAGTAFEWYDFFVFGTLASIIARHFTATSTSATAVMSTTAVSG